MKVTLYKNCILNGNYTEVLRNTELIEDYLDRLQKTEFTIEDTYLKLSGELILEFSQNNIPNNMVIYEYNYVKIENNAENSENVIYAFIDNVEFWNECIKINYSTDTWTTFIGKWTLRESLVTNSYKTIAGETYEKVIPFVGNGKYTISSLFNLSGEVGIVFKFQLYDLVSGGNIDGLKYEGYYVYLKKIRKIDDIVYYTGLPIDNDFSNLLDTFQRIQNEKNWNLRDEADKYYCRIVETYILPIEYLSIDSLYVAVDNEQSKDVCYNQSHAGSIPEYMFYELNTIPDENIVLTSYIPSNPFIYSVGVYTNQIPINFIGIERRLSVAISLTKDTFSLYMILNGNTIEITKSFEFIQDYGTLSADVYAQREIARQQATVKGICGIANGIAQIGIGVGSMVASMGTDVSGVAKVIGGIGSIVQSGYEIPSAFMKRMAIRSIWTMPVICADA